MDGDWSSSQSMMDLPLPQTLPVPHAEWLQIYQVLAQRTGHFGITFTTLSQNKIAFLWNFAGVY